MKTYKLILYFASLFIITINGCKKAEFLDEKPSTNLLVPTTLTDFQALLDNTNVMNFTGGLAQLASDDYTVTDAGYQSVPVATQRNSYIWAKDIFAGEVSIRDWNDLYKQVFYANAVLDGLERNDDASTAQGQYLKGWALFARAFAFYDLTRNFCKLYDPGTANTDLGIPVRLNSGIDNLEQRASLQQSFNQILSDLGISEILLPSDRPSANLNRPSKTAVYALLARIYLDMRNYTQAQTYAEKALTLYSTLIDYNTVSKTSTTPFSITNDELIYNASQVVAYGEFTGMYSATNSRVSPDVLALYPINDLRFTLYFSKLADNTYTVKRGYVGRGTYSFTGLATDELYLIKAECLARIGQVAPAMDVLNQLVIKRWNPDATNPATPYQSIKASNAGEALQKILLERRKELVWRGLRWHDLKRLNKEGANISLTRVVNGATYTIPPNDSRYVFPIPDDEIRLSGIQQNIR